MKGVVKSFSRLKGYGFIQSKELEHEVFVHYTDIDDMDALSLAMEAGSPKAVNIVLMGRVSRYFPEISEEAWLASLEACVPPKFLEMNKKAFMLGRNQNKDILAVYNAKEIRKASFGRGSSRTCNMREEWVNTMAQNYFQPEIETMPVEEIKKLNASLGIPKTLSEVGVTEDKIPQMAADAMKSGNIAANPRQTTLKDVEMLYRKALQYDILLILYM